MAHMVVDLPAMSPNNGADLLTTQLWQQFTDDVNTPFASSDFNGQTLPSPGTKRKFSDDRDIKYKPNIKPSRVDPYSPFFLPPSILLNNINDNGSSTALITTTNTNTSPTSSEANESLLLTLPAELLTQIFQHVKIPYFQVCLALTCKTLGQIASKPGTMAPWRGYRDKDGLFRLLERKAWIARSLRLCRACFIFVPRDQKYWEEKISRAKEFDRRDVNWLDIFNFFDERSFGLHRCPWCNVRGYTSFPSETSYNNLKRQAAIHVEEWNAVCPDVCRRIDQP